MGKQHYTMIWNTIPPSTVAQGAECVLDSGSKTNTFSLVACWFFVFPSNPVDRKSTQSGGHVECLDPEKIWGPVLQ